MGAGVSMPARCWRLTCRGPWRSSLVVEAPAEPSRPSIRPSGTRGLPAETATSGATVAGRGGEPGRAVSCRPLRTVVTTQATSSRALAGSDGPLLQAVLHLAPHRADLAAEAAAVVVTQPIPHSTVEEEADLPLLTQTTEQGASLQEEQGPQPLRVRGFGLGLGLGAARGTLPLVVSVARAPRRLPPGAMARAVVAAVQVPMAWVAQVAQAAMAPWVGLSCG